MIPEIGVFSLIIALGFALLLVIVPTLGLWRDKLIWIDSVSYFVFGQFLFVAIAYLSLTICFLRDDFSVYYVFANSSITLPWFYKLCAVWGGHEGSMLLWVVILCLWTLVVACCSASLSRAMRTRILVVLGLLCVGFLLFLLATSNPFSRQFQLLQTQGRDLNPLLQDLGFLFHPPMLYMGYVGFAVPFAFAIAALWIGRVEPVWAKWTRPWTMAAWCCLTMGITLGSWWAYRELGWGGYWFWDPVENASFMPWLAGTALIHSLMVSEKRQQFLAWTILLAITTFSLSLIGTFLVRSGVLTSVHAFAVDPRRGLSILGFLFAVVGSSLVLFVFRAREIAVKDYPSFISRESLLLLNNVFLVAAMLTILLGTVYPLLVDGLGLGKLSVGAPYFNSVFIPIMIPLFVLMGLGIHINWRQDKLIRLLKGLLPIILLSVIIPIVLLWFLGQTLNIVTLLGLALAGWIILSTLQFISIKIKKQSVINISRSAWGMVLAHLGVAVTAIGITVSSGYGIQNDLKMTLGEQEMLAGYVISFDSSQSLKGANYHGVRTSFTIRRGGYVKTIYPEKRIYDVGHMAMTESAIDVNPFRDLYIALGEPLDDKAWSVRIYYKPFVRWIWAGGFLMLLGGFLAMTDRRYFKGLPSNPNKNGARVHINE